MAAEESGGRHSNRAASGVNVSTTTCRSKPSGQGCCALHAMASCGLTFPFELHPAFYSAYLRSDDPEAEFGIPVVKIGQGSGEKDDVGFPFPEVCVCARAHA